MKTFKQSVYLRFSLSWMLLVPDLLPHCVWIIQLTFSHIIKSNLFTNDHTFSVEIFTLCDRLIFPHCMRKWKKRCSFIF